MLLRTFALIFSLLFSQYAAADLSLFYEDNQADYRDVGVRFDSPNLTSSQNFGQYLGVTLEHITVPDTYYVAAYGHWRSSLFPGQAIEPFLNIGLDLGELLISEYVDNTLDTTFSYGARFNLGGNAIDIYHRYSYLTGYSIVDGTYNAYGIALIINY